MSVASSPTRSVALVAVSEGCGPPQDSSRKLWVFGEESFFGTSLLRFCRLIRLALGRHSALIPKSQRCRELLSLLSPSRSL